jgi:hypothetical protein
VKLLKTEAVGFSEMSEKKQTERFPDQEYRSGSGNPLAFSLSALTAA